MKKQTFIRKMVSVLLIFVLTVCAFSSTSGATDINTEASTQSQYEKPDISIITNEGGSPVEIDGSASALGLEKQWYEYIQYSDKAAGVYYYGEDYRVLFYDPYDYSCALIMHIDESITDWSSANSITTEYSVSSSLEVGYTSGTSSDTSVVTSSDQTVETGISQSIGTSVTHELSESWETASTLRSDTSTSLEESLSTTAGMTVTGGTETNVTLSCMPEGIGSSTTTSASASTAAESSTTVGLTAGMTVSTGVDISSSTGGTAGSSIGEETSTEATSGFSQSFSESISKTLGISRSENQSISTCDSKSVSTTYNATYFNESGSPLQWKIVRYSVYMPLKAVAQFKYGGEWYTMETSYCILTTITGTCRSFIENDTVYFEHWGNGKPVVQEDFWSGFFTSGDALKEAYRNKAYPDPMH